MECCTKGFHKMVKSFIYKIMNGVRVRKCHAFLRVVPELILFPLLLPLMVADFYSNNFINNNWGSNKFVLILPLDKNYKYYKE